MRDPIAYTYDADTHCPDCAVARFGRELYRTWDHRALCSQCGEAGNLVPASMADTAHRHGPTSHPFTPRVHPWPPEDARDSEGNPVGAIAPWDDWCDAEDGPCTLACGTCHFIIATHGPHNP